VSVHGANRLGVNSLLETIVFGKLVGETKPEYLEGFSTEPDSSFLLEEIKRQESRIKDIISREKTGETVAGIITEMRETVFQNCGVFRQKKKLIEGHDKIRELLERYRRVALQNNKTRRFNPALVNVLELKGMLLMAELIIAGAVAREECRGAHWRTDFPARDDGKWLKHTMAVFSGDGPVFSYTEVEITDYEPGERQY
jgi:succinate dehydrogenase / fumarate reductase flavoprotein subunit